MGESTQTILCECVICSVVICVELPASRLRAYEADGDSHELPEFAQVAFDCGICPTCWEANKHATV